MSIEKLNLDYFKGVEVEDFKVKVKKYCEFFHFNEDVVNECLKIYDKKVKDFKSDVVVG